MFSSACSELQRPTTAPFFAETPPPRKQEFRWSNGGTPKTFDPALAAAPPETDIARAIFAGLTDIDARTLEERPALAERWEASKDFKTWTFYLRSDARWSNGERVVASDFVNSWKRAAEVGEGNANAALLSNIVGMQVKGEEIRRVPAQVPDFLTNQNVEPGLKFLPPPLEGDIIVPIPQLEIQATPTPVPQPVPTKPTGSGAFGVTAVSDTELKVTLVKPDRDLPKLVSHPIFRPVFDGGKEFNGESLNAAVTTNGAFRISSVGADGVTLDRSENYWDKEKVNLERVRFVPSTSAESALNSYQAGDIDAITNADFEPLALKLLSPFDDFRRATHSALNFYEFNLNRPPFNDRRVREALAIAIDRERLTEGEMKGSTQPALSFLPFNVNRDTKLTQDAEKARGLLERAGYPNGADFPPVRLVINRNDIQQRVARSVAAMWKQNLNIETEIIVKESSEMEAVRAAGDFDVMRRGVVLPTTNETANLNVIFGSQPYRRTIGAGVVPESSETPTVRQTGTDAANTARVGVSESSVLTETDAILEVYAIPLYFPTSYSLVKPYVQGFEMNSLDAPDLKAVSIDNNWQPKPPKDES